MRNLRLESLERRELLAAEPFGTIRLPAGVETGAAMGEGGAIPTFAPIGDLSLMRGSPLHVPVDGFDLDGGPLRVTVSVEDPLLVEATVLSGNRSVRLEVDDYGDMVFQLFEQRVPRTTERIATLVESGFYDGILFHRVDDGFVLQAGDPTGTGRSGSDLGAFDDEFHADLQHSGRGVLSFAKTSDDTNNSQFFITETDTHFLDFNHAVFGQLTEGENVRELISSVPVDEDEKPESDVVIRHATLFSDTENSVVMLRALADSGGTEVTFTITDMQGNASSETVTVDLTPDFANAQPFLQPITQSFEVASGANIEVPIQSVDLEGDAVVYLASTDSTNVSGSLDPATGLLELTPFVDYTGTFDIFVGVQAASNANGNFDSQKLSFTVFNSFHDPLDQYNVNRESGVTALDALEIINALNQYGDSIPVSVESPEFLLANYRYNVNGDDQITALDALQVINQLKGSDNDPPSGERIESYDFRPSKQWDNPIALGNAAPIPQQEVATPTWIPLYNDSHSDRHNDDAQDLAHDEAITSLF
ncbi:peptidylprolyl isomerase [Novipirellula herctigrandis]|uniref:peptidylprolyl isomerase n=1 Tax=Novipirellula herctigrandis TaxID=2527986 RepID=UPI003AF3F672